MARDGTLEAIASLERVLSVNRSHPGALHYWIHLWEPTKTPERAEQEADRLLPLMPGAGHIIHMPAHIYMRVGRYADAVKANQQAVAADEDYIAQCKAQGMYPLGYYPHNIHFVWMGATMSGQGAVALAAARKVAAAIPAEALATVPPLQSFLVVPYWAMVQFERVGRDSRRTCSRPRYDLHARGVALRARPGAGRDGACRRGRAGTRGTHGHRLGQGAANAAGIGVAQHAGRDPADRP